MVYFFAMKIKTLQVGSFEVNCTLLVAGEAALIVDPGQDADAVLDAVAGLGARPAAALLTHGHFDHINALPGLLAAIPDLPVYVTAEDAQVMAHPLNALAPEYAPVRLTGANFRPVTAAALKFDGFPDIVPLPTPGHTPGGVCYHIPAEGLLLAGDTLFAGSVGRTDLPGGDMATLMKSLQSLKALPPETKVIPGHGPFTTIGRECAENMFLQ